MVIMIHAGWPRMVAAGACDGSDSETRGGAPMAKGVCIGGRTIGSGIEGRSTGMPWAPGGAPWP